jgi:hypothetical protein
MKILVLALAAVLTLSACSTTEPADLTAEQLTVQELTTTPGYAWFNAEMSGYTPDPAAVSEIRTAMQTSPERRICIFVKPACTCRGTQRLFPQVMKALMAANVDLSRVEIWSMRAATDRHRYEGVLTIAELPSIFVLENGTMRSKVSDRDYDETNAAQLIADALK